MWWATRVVAVVAVGVLAAGCSGSNASPSTTPAPVATTVAVTDLPTTSAVSTTEPVPTTVPVPTTSAPVTTVPLSDEEAVLAAYQASYDAFWAASQAPNDPELRRALEATSTGEILELSIKALDEYVVNNQRVIPNADVPDGYAVSSIVVDGPSAVVESCQVNSWIIVEDTSTGVIVVDDSVPVSKREVHFELVDGRWVRSGEFFVGDLDVGQCDV
jgi:hypothetical protein